jgi:opacity protein-like surface antigen
MVSVRLLIATAAASVLANAAFAADMSMPPLAAPPAYQPQMAYAPQPVPQAVSGWYLRGDVGVGVQSFQNFDHTQQNSAFVWPASWTIVQKDVQDTSIFGAGIGYELNNWFRFDVTGEYRTKAEFKATGSYTNFCAGGGICFDTTPGNYSSVVVMANAYVDLGTWWCITPYIGAGLGGAYNRISGVQDNGLNSDGSQGFGYTASDSTKWDFAWNAKAGITYNVSNNFKVDMGVRYLHLGSPMTSVVFCQDTPSCPNASYNLTNMNSWDFRLGVRWMLQPDVAPMMAAPAPLMSRG